MAPLVKVETALDKLSELPVRIYATGPLVRYGLLELTQAYRQWSQQQATQDTTVALLYASAYGNTATLAQTIARGITKLGSVWNRLTAKLRSQLQAAVKISWLCYRFTYTRRSCAHPIQTAWALSITATNNKLAGCFLVHGWSGSD